MQSLDDAPGKIPPTGKVVGSAWRKSTRSIANGQCVEAAMLADGRLAVRDSVDKSGPMVMFAIDEWHSFVKEIKDGSFW